MFKQLLTAAIIAVLITVTGCGGTKGTNSGGFKSSGSNTPGQAQAVYSGTASNGTAFQTIILPTDQYYAIYGTTSGNTFTISGMLTGQGVSNDGKYTATVTDFSNTGTTNTGSVSASYVVGSSITGTLTETGNPALTFAGTVMPSSSFNYGAAASLADITGSWTGTLLDGTSATVTINANGNFSGSDSGCLFSGTIRPSTSGKNFFDVSMSFGASPCASPNQTASGVAIDYLLSDGITHQLLAGVSSGSTFGTVFVGNR
jgi:hypothetical protein